MKYLRPKEVREKYGIGRTTLLSLEIEGKISPVRTLGKQRRYSSTELDSLYGVTQIQTSEKYVIYSRVSSRGQLDDGNLDRQVTRLKEWAINNGADVLDVISEVGSGVNEKRRGLLKLLTLVEQKSIQGVIIEYRDRLARFGYHYIQKYLSSYGVKIVVLHERQLGSENQELVEDLTSIISSFSARIHGRRGGKRNES
jgi:predicted site-specific integrase-resolvase